MKIIIRNWGPVKEYTCDLSKSIVVTYGDNNIGKSYAMQVIYLFLKHLIAYSKRMTRISIGAYYYLDEIDTDAPEVQLLIDFFRRKDIEIEDISEKLQEVCAKRMAEELFSRMKDSYANTFGTYDTMMREEPEIEIRVDTELQCIFNFSKEEIELYLKRKPTRLRKSLSDFHKCRNGKNHYDIYVYGNYLSAPVELVGEEIIKIRREICIAILKKISNVYFLPASRSGIYTGMSSFGPILAQLSQNRAYIKGSIQIPSIPEPISDYYMMLSEIKGEPQEKLLPYAKEIEKEVLKGEILFDKKRKSIIYKPFETDMRLEMQDTSSMVSEISPITAFLKYVVEDNVNFRIKRLIGLDAKPRAVIFIEEPETHLHPMNQIKLMKAFVKLTNENITLAMASHSNYIFNQLNNLILGQELDKNDYSPILLQAKGGKSRSFDMTIDEFGADDENFADVSEKLMTERESLIEKLLQEQWENEQADDSDNCG